MNLFRLSESQNFKLYKCTTKVVSPQIAESSFSVTTDMTSFIKVSIESFLILVAYSVLI